MTTPSDSESLQEDAPPVAELVDISGGRNRVPLLVTPESPLFAVNRPDLSELRSDENTSRLRNSYEQIEGENGPTNDRSLSQMTAIRNHDLQLGSFLTVLESVSNEPRINPNSDYSISRCEQNSREILSAGDYSLQALLPTQNFEPFPEFPEDISRMIWKLALPPPRFIYSYPVGAREIQGVVHQTTWNKFQGAQLIGEPDGYVTSRTLDNLLQTSSESRNIVQETYKLCFAQELSAPIYFNVKKDVLIFELSKTFQGFLRCLGSCTLTDDVRPLLFLSGHMGDWALNAERWVSDRHHLSDNPVGALENLDPNNKDFYQNLAVNAKWALFKEIIIDAGKAESVQRRDPRTYSSPCPFDDDHRAVCSRLRRIENLMKHLLKVRDALQKEPRWNGGKPFLIPKISIMSEEALKARLSGQERSKWTDMPKAVVGGEELEDFVCFPGEENQTKKAEDGGVWVWADAVNNNCY
ncbi:hypothetical protein GLAREA_03504 [Glarea lozoyensis ATCC 20868]|uniref:2EXR domain-containing protein n=1 Tax=Glarea lozoyensis (strain ATCC 20868 / MF5171) TaxID=1116229 RepID=S3CVU7_GLAL2|nr:uncharacterized protein GLAREA_03504 [Glarea lozoyensis ATCC 20868]EPE30537.1 hypothetical protein GLAREA_03504 [Glarea lozoyensis ATCC 20868]